MNRSPARRLGALLLTLLWAQIATANAIPCAIHCHEMAAHMAGETAMHAGVPGMSHGVMHGMSAPALSAPEHCGAPLLLVTLVVQPDLPAVASVSVPVLQQRDGAPLSPRSAPPAFDTPPPRA